MGPCFLIFFCSFVVNLGPLGRESNKSVKKNTGILVLHSQQLANIIKLILNGLFFSKAFRIQGGHQFLFSAQGCNQLIVPNTVQSMGILGQLSSRSKLDILFNQQSDPIINRVFAPTKLNSSTKYEQDTQHIVSCGAITYQDSNTSQCAFIKFQSTKGS